MYTPTSLGHSHLTSYFPFQDLPISVSHFSKFRFTVCKTFPFNSTICGVILGKYRQKNCANWKFSFKLQISLHLPFPVKMKNHWL